MNLIKVQKQEIGISSDSSSSSDRSWDCSYPGRKAVTERDHSVFWDILSCSLLIWEVVIQVCSVCENFMMWAVFFCILYSSKIVKEYINSISTDMKQPARYYVKKKKKQAWIKHFHRCEKMGKYTCTWLYIHTIHSERCSTNWQLWLYVKRDS